MAKQMADLIVPFAELNVEALPAQARMAYNKMKAAKASAREATQAFETVMRDSNPTPKGTRMVFGYNFGKLSVALAPDDAKTAKASSKAMSLTDWLKQNA